MTTQAAPLSPPESQQAEDHDTSQDTTNVPPESQQEEDAQSLPPESPEETVTLTPESQQEDAAIEPPPEPLEQPEDTLNLSPELQQPEDALNPQSEPQQEEVPTMSSDTPEELKQVVQPPESPKEEDAPNESELESGPRREQPPKSLLHLAIDRDSIFLPWVPTKRVVALCVRNTTSNYISYSIQQPHDGVIYFPTRGTLGSGEAQEIAACVSKERKEGEMSTFSLEWRIGYGSHRRYAEEVGKLEVHRSYRFNIYVTFGLEPAAKAALRDSRRVLLRARTSPEKFLALWQEIPDEVIPQRRIRRAFLSHKTALLRRLASLQAELSAVDAQIAVTNTAVQCLPKYKHAQSYSLTTILMISFFISSLLTVLFEIWRNRRS